jgi:hypothetical protein
MKFISFLLILFLTVGVVEAQTEYHTSPFKHSRHHKAATGTTLTLDIEGPDSRLIIYSIAQTPTGVTYKAVVRSDEGPTYFLLENSTASPNLKSAGIYDATIFNDGKTFTVSVKEQHYLAHPDLNVVLTVIAVYNGDELYLPELFQKEPFQKSDPHPIAASGNHA